MRASKQLPIMYKQFKLFMAASFITIGVLGNERLMLFFRRLCLEQTTCKTQMFLSQKVFEKAIHRAHVICASTIINTARLSTLTRIASNPFPAPDS